MTTTPSPLAPQSKQKKIGDCAYTVEPLGFLSGRKVFVKVLNVLGPSFSSLEDKPTSPEDGLRALGALVGGLMERVSDADLEYLDSVFAPKTMVVTGDNRVIRLSEHLATHWDGRPITEYFTWLAFCLEATFGDFFGALPLKSGVSQSAPVKGSP